MTMSMVMSSNVPRVRAEMLTELKPTVVIAVMVWKNDTSRRSSLFRCATLVSERNMSPVPRMVNTSVVLRMIWLVNVMLFVLPRMWRQTSTNTMKPMAPEKLRMDMTTLSQKLSYNPAKLSGNKLNPAVQNADTL